MFDHEKLNVYQKAILFNKWLFEFLKEQENLSAVLTRQLDKAAISIPLNIAEGNGRYRADDKIRFFHIARGSALECAACLDLIKIVVTGDNEVEKGKKILSDVVSMLMGLIKSQANRVQDVEDTYLTEKDHDQEHDHDQDF